MSKRRHRQGILLFRDISDIQSGFRMPCCGYHCRCCPLSAKNTSHVLTCTKENYIFQRQRQEKPLSVFDYFYEQLYSDKRNISTESTRRSSTAFPCKTEMEQISFGVNCADVSQDPPFTPKMEKQTTGLVYKSSPDSPIPRMGSESPVKLKDFVDPKTTFCRNVTRTKMADNGSRTFGVPLGCFEIYLAQETHQLPHCKQEKQNSLLETFGLTGRIHNGDNYHKKDTCCKADKTRNLIRKKRLRGKSSSESSSSDESSESSSNDERNRRQHTRKKNHTKPQKRRQNKNNRSKLSISERRDPSPDRVRVSPNASLPQSPKTSSLITDNSDSVDTSESDFKWTKGSENRNERSRSRSETESRSPSSSSSQMSKSRSSSSSRSRNHSNSHGRTGSTRWSPYSLSTSRTRSYSRSRDKSISSVRSCSRRYSRGVRSPSIRRRRGSPCYLDKRRITSARKRPVPYLRPTPLSTSSSSDSDSSFSSYRTRSPTSSSPFRSLVRSSSPDINRG